MQTDYLRFLVATIETGSYASAAKKFYMTPEGVSRAIKALEKQTNTKLVERRNNRIEPTSSGALFYQSAKEIIAEIETLKKSVEEQGQCTILQPKDEKYIQA